MNFTKNGLLQKGVLVGSVVLLLNACKEPDGIGLDVLPAGQQLPIAWVDSFTLEARTVLDDSVITSVLSSYLIGDFGDPIFGRVRSQLFTQLKLSSESPDFGTNPMVDSVILHLTYSGSYGYTDKLRGTMNFGVFRLAEDLQDTALYYSNVDPHEVDPTALASIEFRPDLYSEIDLGEYVDDTISVLRSPALRIPLDLAFGQEILTSLNLADEDLFSNEFKGINIRSESIDMPSGFGSILNFNLGTAFSGIELYYHHDDEDSLRFDLDILQPITTHTIFSHDYAPAIEDVLVGGTATKADRLYTQSMAGLKIKVELPFLKELNNLGAVAINKAEILVPMDPSFDPEHDVPLSIVFREIIDTLGTSSYTDDFNPNTLSYYGGVYDSEKHEYVFNAARYVQSILNSPEEENRGFYIREPSRNSSARRGVFNGPQHPTDPMRLRMTYTIIE